MTLAQILLSSYLVVGLLATIVILAALRASKGQRNRQGENAKHDKIIHNLFREKKTRPSKSG